VSEGLRILIVEGNPADAGFIHDMLPQAGPLQFQVEPVRKLSEALARLEQKDIDLVLLNLVLPDSQGLQTFHLLQKAAPEIPVIVLAGSDDHEMAIAAVQDGAQDYLVKGQVSARPLIRAVRYALARQKAAAVVRWSETQLHAVLESTADGILAVDNMGKVIKASRRFAELWRVPQSLLDAGNDRAILNFVCEQLSDPAAFLKRVRSLYRSDEEGTDILDFKDGRVFERQTFPLLMNGVNSGRVWSFRDITERKKAEAAARQGEERYKALFDRSLDCVFLTDFDGRFLDANKASLDLLGYRREDIPSLTFASLLTEDQLLLAFQVTEEIKATGHQKCPTEYRLRGKDGRQVYVETQSSLIHRDGKPFAIQGIARDITGRKRAEEALRDNEAFLNTVIENIPHMIFVKDTKELRFVKFNKAGQELLGYSLAELAGKNDYDFFPKELADHFTEQDRQVLRGKEIVDIPEEPVQTREKGARILHTKKIPIFDNAGQLLYLLGISEDITEHKRADAALRESESQLQVVLESTADGILAVNSKGKVIKANQRFAELWRIPQFLMDAGDDRAILDFVLEQLSDPDAFLKKVQSLYGTDAASMDTLVFKDGRIFERYSSPMLTDGMVTGRVWSFRDITERKRAEQQLAETLDFNRKIISDASVGIIVFKASGRCVLANETAAQTLNATVSRIMEQDFRQLVSWRASGILQFAEDALAMKEPRQCEANFVSTFGKEVSLVCHFSPFVQNGEPHLLLVFNDVTEKKRLEAQFLRAQRMESIGTLAGGIAHDLNNVLAPLLISVQLLKDKITDADGRKILVMLETNVNRGSELVKQVLAFGRGIQGERVMIQIKHIALEIKEIVQKTFPKSVRMQMEIAPDLWKVTGDATQIEQVLLNLCVNARDAMPDGGKLSLRMENKLLDQIYADANLESKPGRHVVLTVSDTGMGMTREVQDRIFEPFFTTKGHGKGTGLGLSTTLAIVKSHGGFIHCYSEPGTGSTFKVYLPVGAAPDIDTVLLEKPKLPRGHNEMVLVVDDEEPIRHIAEKILERFGYRVLLAVDGAEALKLYMSRQNEIDVVITDMAMPVMDGHATIAALRAINPKVKVIGSSGFDVNEGTTGVANAGLKHFMPKPYTAEAVLSTLHKVLHENPVK
jgi:PAS domain S-box-containing protein